ncbi:MAG: hypothetical protein HZB41_13910 [Ignavibacteriae bacterium]|nr:hypothetical protein [Ignavibacteriota bacterium]
MKIIILLITILITFQLFSCRTSFREYWNNPGLEKENKDFSDIYDNRKNTTSFKTKGFYFCLDSIWVYKMIMQGQEVYRYKFIVDEYSKDKQWKAWNKILDTNLAYYFQYLWINEDGTCFVANWNMLSNDFDGPNYLISEKSNLNSDTVIDKISSQIENYWNENFKVASRRIFGLGAYEDLKDSVNLYYFIGQLELPDYLEHISGRILNDTTIKLYKIWEEDFIPNKTSKQIDTKSKISEYIFKFRATEVIPSKQFMIIE